MKNKIIISNWKLRQLSVILISLLICGCNSLSINQNITFKEVNYGLYDADLSHRKDNSTSASGKRTISINNEFYKTTTNIPLQQEIQFGSEFIIYSNINTSVELDIIWKYPEKIRNNKGIYFTEDKRTVTRYTNQKTWTGYILNQEYEMVNGTWILEIYHRDRLLYQKKFLLEE
jgi:hypothetical protein